MQGGVHHHYCLTERSSALRWTGDLVWGRPAPFPMSTRINSSTCDPAQDKWRWMTNGWNTCKQLMAVWAVVKSQMLSDHFISQKNQQRFNHLFIWVILRGVSGGLKWTEPSPALKIRPILKTESWKDIWRGSNRTTVMFLSCQRNTVVSSVKKKYFKFSKQRRETL